MTTLHEFSVQAEFPAEMEDAEAQREMAEAIDVHLASEGMIPRRA
jgi:hypothetical protein